MCHYLLIPNHHETFPEPHPAFGAGLGEIHSAESFHPSRPQRELTSVIAVSSVTPIFFPFHNPCAFLHWWSSGITSPARRAFTATKGEVERDGLSHAGVSLRVSFLGNLAGLAGNLVILISALLCDSDRQDCCLSSSVKAPAWPVGCPLPLMTMKPNLSSPIIACLKETDFLSLARIAFSFRHQVANTLVLRLSPNLDLCVDFDGGDHRIFPTIKFWSFPELQLAPTLPSLPWEEHKIIPYSRLLKITTFIMSDCIAHSADCDNTTSSLDIVRELR